MNSKIGDLTVSAASAGMIPLGRRAVVKAGRRYYLWLPMAQNALWEELHERGVKVEVWVRIPNQ